MVLKPINRKNWLGKQSGKKSDLKPATDKWKSVKIITVKKPKWFRGKWKRTYQVVKR